jgi:hydroxyacylglutathione hydrolase
MIFRQILRSESGCASYLLGCPINGEAIVIDPLAELGASVYALEAADRGLRIAWVIDTHIHADHRSAAQNLARATGATLALPAGSPVEYPFHQLRDGDIIQAGGVRLHILHTPGHTPESICLLGADTARSEEPWFLLSGDTLFPGDVGRPDLLLDNEAATEHTATQARQLYNSLFERLLKLDDIVEVYPGHFGGSACGGVNMSGKPASTIGFERRWNLALQHHDPEKFVHFVLETLRPQPEGYQQIKRSNLRTLRAAEPARSAPAARHDHGSAGLARLTPGDVKAMADEGVVLVDLRPAGDFAAAHAPGALSVPFNRAELVDSLLKLAPADTDVMLVADNSFVADEAAGLLRESGYHVRGVLEGGMAVWWRAGQGVATLALWPIEMLHKRLGERGLVVVDVREPHEWADGVIPGALLIPQANLRARQADIPREAQIVTICAGGVRSARAASLLAHLGFPHVSTVERAGMGEWMKRGYPIINS